MVFPYWFLFLLITIEVENLPSLQRIMDYLYYLGNASHTLRVFEYLNTRYADLLVEFVTAIHQIDGWVIRVKLTQRPTGRQSGDFQAFMNELGVLCDPSVHVKLAFRSLETGQSPVEVMRHYQVAVVSHGSPDRTEIEEFREQFIQGLGYCPETLA